MNVVTNIYLLIYFKIDYNNNFFISLSQYRFGTGEAFQNLDLLLFVYIDASVPNFPQEWTYMQVFTNENKVGLFRNVT